MYKVQPYSIMERELGNLKTNDEKSPDGKKNNDEELPEGSKNDEQSPEGWKKNEEELAEKRLNDKKSPEGWKKKEYRTSEGETETLLINETKTSSKILDKKTSSKTPNRIRTRSQSNQSKHQK